MKGSISDSFAQEVSQGTRFEFGENWARFLLSLNEKRILIAKQSLETMLGQGYLSGRSFLDIGSGSGLFSLVARQLGAKVHSFDYDPQSVACTEELKRRYFEKDTEWTVGRGSALDPEYLGTLGKFDVVYSWGVLHHTGNMWRALELVAPLVKPGGKLYIALYNDQGRASIVWKKIKQLYNGASRVGRSAVVTVSFFRLWGPTLTRDVLRGRPLITWKNYQSTSRGMSPWRDVIDWVGGYPFEVAKPEAILRFFRDRGFRMLDLTTCAGGLGCNEYVFCKAEDDPSSVSVSSKTTGSGFT